MCRYGDVEEVWLDGAKGKGKGMDYKFNACLHLSISSSESIKAHKDIAHFETAYVVKLHRVAKLAPPQPVFSFSHPNYSRKASNQRYTKLQFEVPQDTGSCLVHGFAGYFDAVLYKDVHVGIEPYTATPNMFS